MQLHPLVRACLPDNRDGLPEDAPDVIRDLVNMVGERLARDGEPPSTGSLLTVRANPQILCDAVSEMISKGVNIKLADMSFKNGKLSEAGNGLVATLICSFCIATLKLNLALASSNAGWSVTQDLVAMLKESGESIAQAVSSNPNVVALMRGYAQALSTEDPIISLCKLHPQLDAALEEADKMAGHPARCEAERNRVVMLIMTRVDDVKVIEKDFPRCMRGVIDVASIDAQLHDVRRRICAINNFDEFEDIDAFRAHMRGMLTLYGKHADKLV